MNFIKGGITINRLQWLVWAAVFLIIFFSLLPEDGLYPAASFTIISVAFYALVIYGNINFLFPRLYEKGHKVIYIISAIIFLISAGLGRGYLVMFLYNQLSKKPEPITTGMIVNFVVAGFLTYLLSFIFRIALAYFTLKQQSEKIMTQKSQAELNLLKSQVQPHFLFNTLNNIYYEAYLEAPNTAKLIERLSDIMRYFVDESPKDEVSLSTEIQFIENYIALEKIRIRHSIKLSFTHDCNPETRIPPMLLMTFVENIFKHGIDKSSSENEINITLLQIDGFLLFKTENRLCDKTRIAATNGFGIQNLGKRLAILYGERFQLTINDSNQCFTAILKVPLS